MGFLRLCSFLVAFSLRIVFFFWMLVLVFVRIASWWVWGVRGVVASSLYYRVYLCPVPSISVVC